MAEQTAFGRHMRRRPSQFGGNSTQFHDRRPSVLSSGSRNTSLASFPRRSGRAETQIGPYTAAVHAQDAFIQQRPHTQGVGPTFEFPHTASYPTGPMAVHDHHPPCDPVSQQQPRTVPLTIIDTNPQLIHHPPPTVLRPNASPVISFKIEKMRPDELVVQPPRVTPLLLPSHQTHESQPVAITTHAQPTNSPVKRLVAKNRFNFDDSEDEEDVSSDAPVPAEVPKLVATQPIPRFTTASTTDLAARIETIGLPKRIEIRRDMNQLSARLVSHMERPELHLVKSAPVAATPSSIIISQHDERQYPEMDVSKLTLTRSPDSLEDVKALMTQATDPEPILPEVDLRAEAHVQDVVQNHSPPVASTKHETLDLLSGSAFDVTSGGAHTSRTFQRCWKVSDNNSDALKLFGTSATACNLTLSSFHKLDLTIEWALYATPTEQQQTQDARTQPSLGRKSITLLVQTRHRSPLTPNNVLWVQLINHSDRGRKRTKGAPEHPPPQEFGLAPDFQPTTETAHSMIFELPCGAVTIFFPYQAEHDALGVYATLKPLFSLPATEAVAVFVHVAHGSVSTQ